MKESLVEGLCQTQHVDIDPGRTIEFMGDDCRVYGTPFLLFDIEMTCRDLLMQHADKGEDSVGTHIELDHTGATLQGMWVEISATLVSINGPAVEFDIVARDSIEEVATAHHKRFIVDIEKTAERLKLKKTLADDSS